MPSLPGAELSSIRIGVDLIYFQNFQQAPDRSRNQTPRYLLSHNGVVKMELYNSPLMIDTTKPDRAKATTISRARPIISSSPRAGLHPNSSVTAPSIRPSYQRKSWVASQHWEHEISHPLRQWHIFSIHPCYAAMIFSIVFFFIWNITFLLKKLSTDVSVYCTIDTGIYRW